MRATLAVLVLLASPFIVNAFPYLWANNVLPNEVLKGAALTPTNCIRHPTTKEAGHGAPTVDRTITITAEAGGKAVKELCPGVETTVTVNYPERRRTLLTTTEGAWDKANRTCPGLTLTTRTQASYDTYSAKLTIPCNSTAESTTLQVTSATGSSAPYKTATMTMPIAALDKCPASKCPPAANKTAEANETVPLDNDMMSVNETLTDGNMTLSVNETMEGNATAGNETIVEDVTLTEGNATAAGNKSATGRNGTKGAAADKAADAVNATKSAAAAAKPKSAAAASSPAGVLAAACMFAAAAIVL